MKMARMFCAIACASIGLLPMLVQAASTTPATAYHIIARYPIGGNDVGYDYLKVDAPKRRLYVAHGTRVEVLNVDTGQKIGELSGMHGVHGIEIIPELGKGYTSDGLDRAVTVFERDSMKTRKLIKYTGVKPDSIKYDPESRQLFVVNGGESGDVTVIDPTSDAIVATVALEGKKLEQIGFDGRGHGFVNDEGKNVVHVFDTHSLAVVATWSLSPCEEPTGLAIDTNSHRLFAACGNEKLAVLDSDSGRVVAMAPIGSDPDGAAFDPGSKRIFTSNRDGTLSVLREVTPDQYETLQTVTTEPGARTIALDERTGHIFMPTAKTEAHSAGSESAPLIPQTFTVLVAGE